MSSPHSGPLEADVYRALNRQGLAGPARAAWVISTANLLAKGRYKAVKFRANQLTLMPGSLPALELQMISGKLREAINKKLGQNLIRSVRIKQS